MRDESEGYAVYSNGKVVALFGIYKCDPGAVTGGTTMSNVGLEVVSEHAERSWHLCALAALRFFRRAVRDASIRVKP